MNLRDYYSILGVRQGASDDEIRKAYRSKAMEFHPDRNNSEAAPEMFIRITEAYEYLTSHPHSRNISREEAEKNYRAWVDYRQAEARKRAEAYSRTTYSAFKKSPIYKSTSVIDGTMVFLGLVLAVTVIGMTIFGYSSRMRTACTPREEPSLPLALVTLTTGVSYLLISLLYLSAWIAQQKRKKQSKNVRENKNQESV
jgi:DnaJ domain